jgi:hypothetical protein
VSTKTVYRQTIILAEHFHHLSPHHTLHSCQDPVHLGLGVHQPVHLLAGVDQPSTHRYLQDHQYLTIFDGLNYLPHILGLDPLHGDHHPLLPELVLKLPPQTVHSLSGDLSVGWVLGK